MKLFISYPIIVLIFLSCIFDFQAQTIQKTIKSLKTKKYNAAAPFLLSAENGFKKNTELLYCLSIFYAAPTNYQNKGKAAYYFRDANLAYSKSTFKEKKQLKTEFKIDEKSMLKALNQVAKAVYPYFTIEGDLSALREFSEIFPEYALSESKATKDWDIANEGENLKLEQGYNSELEKEYRAFIKKAGPKEIALAALQVLASPKIAKKDWEAAAQIFEKYQKEFSAQDYRIAKIINMLREKTDEIPIKSIGKQVNSSGDNYAPVLSADEKKLFFCGRNRKDNLGNEDIFESSYENNDWNKPELLKGINKRRENEAPLSLSSDKRMMITYKKGDLWYSRQSSEMLWSEPLPINNINTNEFTEIDASITPDGNAILFASDKEGNFGTFHHLGDKFNGGFMGNMDIYVSKKINDSIWSKPVNIGKSINSNLCERSPFLHPDMKTLYFSSANYGSLGGLDVYKSTRLSDTSWTEWSEPVNLGKSVNTVLDDFDYKFSADGKKAIFTAINNKSVFIAVMELPEKKQIEEVKLVVNITDSVTNKAIIAQVSIDNLTDNFQLVSQSTNSNGQISETVLADKQFIIHSESPGYQSASDKFDTYNLRDTSQIVRNIKMSPLPDILIVDMDNIDEEPVTITLNNILFDYNLYGLKPESFPELNRLVNFVKQYPDVFIVISGHTDNSGEKNYNKKLSENRAISVKNYLVKKGCNEKHLKTAGYGDERPVDTNETDEGRENNRRVELSISTSGFSE